MNYYYYYYYSVTFFGYRGRGGNGSPFDRRDIENKTLLEGGHRREISYGLFSKTP